MAAPQEVVVSTKLVIDDQSSEVLKRVQAGYKSTSKAQQDVARETKQTQQRMAADQKRYLDQNMRAIFESEKLRAANARQQANDQIAQAQRVHDQAGGFIKQFAATFLAVNAMSAINEVREFSHEVMVSATAIEEQQRAVTGLIAGIQGVPWRVASREAGELEEKIEDIALATGHMREEDQGGFTELVSMLGGTQKAFDTAKQQIGDISNIAQKTGHNVTELGEDYGLLVQGMIRPRNELYNLLRATSAFGKSTRDARAEWQKLSEDERIKRLNLGIQQISANLKGVAPTARDIFTTLSTFKEVAVEEFGKSVLSELLPDLREMTADIGGSKDKLKEYARTMGKDVGQWVRSAAKDLRTGFEYVQTHAKQIEEAVKEGFRYARETFDFILSHKAEIAMAFGAKTVLSSGIVKSVVSAGAAGGSAFAGVGGAFAGAAGAAVSVAALGAAIVGLGAAAYQAYQLYKEMGGGRGEAEQQMDAIADKWKRLAEDGHKLSDAEQKQLDHERQNYVDLATARNMDSEAMGMYLDHLHEQHNDLRKVIGPIDDLGAALAAVSAQAAAVGGDEGSYMMAKAEDEAANKVMLEFMDDVHAGKAALAAKVADTVAGSNLLQKALLDSTTITAGALSAFADALTDKNSKFYAAVKQNMTQAEKLEKPHVNTNFYGGQTFKIQQDFRDEDPDRVAFVFQRDIRQAAMRRNTFGTSAPFGS